MRLMAKGLFLAGLPVALGTIWAFAGRGGWHALAVAVAAAYLVPFAVIAIVGAMGAAVVVGQITGWPKETDRAVR